MDVSIHEPRRGLVLGIIDLSNFLRIPHHASNHDEARVETTQYTPGPQPQVKVYFLVIFVFAKVINSVAQLPFLAFCEYRGPIQNPVLLFGSKAPENK